MKTVVDRDMVAHLWAHQTQHTAKNSNGTFFFRDSTIYSYGGHFPIARHVRGTRGRKAVLFTTRTYSVTTSGHIARVRAALPDGVTVFRVVNPDAAPAAVLDTLAKRIQVAALDCQRRRKKDEALSALRRAVAVASGYAEFIGSRRRFGAPDDFDLESAERLAASCRKKEAAQRRAQERKARAAAEKYAVELRERLARWLTGEQVHVGYFPLGVPEHGKAFLRVKPTDPTMVETSLGAEFPVAHCARLMAIVRSGVGYKHNGHTEYAGVFRVDEIDTEGNVKAGCHYVTRAECDRFAAVLGI